MSLFSFSGIILIGGFNMQKIKWASYEAGDILDYVDKVDIIGHQVNCLGVMGGGLALQIAQKYPKVEEAYRKYIDDWCQHGTQKHLLGHCQIVPTVNKSHIANLFGQYHVGGGLRTDYEALHKSLKELKTQMLNRNLTKIALPVNLGCGLAGGDWNIVQDLIEDVFEDLRIQLILVEYKPR